MYLILNQSDHLLDSNRMNDAVLLEYGGMDARGCVEMDDNLKILKWCWCHFAFYGYRNVRVVGSSKTTNKMKSWRLLNVGFWFDTYSMYVVFPS